MQIVGGAKFHSLLSAHHLIGAYLITTKSDKLIHLLTAPHGHQLRSCLLCMPRVGPVVWVYSAITVSPLLDSEHSGLVDA